MFLINKYCIPGHPMQNPDELINHDFFKHLQIITYPCGSGRLKFIVESTNVKPT
jgi:hypothetical protein